MLLAAAGGYEGELAVVALAHIMRARGVSLHQAIVAASEQHAAIMVGLPSCLVCLSDSMSGGWCIACVILSGFFPCQIRCV